MKIKDAINMANLMENGNAMPKELAILFLSELDGMIQSDIMLHAPEEIVSYDNEEQELLLRPPHDKLYVHYLVMMIRNQQQEYEGYQNTQASVDEKLKTFRRWYVQHYRPADTDSRSYMGGTSADAFGFAYLTAYGLAVRNGYQGTEEQWLESLHGETGAPGAPARMRYDAERETIQWGVGDTWYDLFSLQALRDPVVAAFLREAGELAEAAAGSETAARGHAKTAENAAAGALASAGRAEEQANRAGAAELGAAGEASRAADRAQRAAVAQTAAETAAGDAQTQAQTASNHAKAAEESAKRAEAAAENAGGGSAGDIGDAIDGHDTNLAAHLNMQDNLNGLRDKAISKAIDSHDTNLAAHPYFHERCNDLEEALKGKLGTGELPEAINTALAQARDSGDFDGADGRGIKSIARTSGNGAAGTTDTYTITYTDGTKSTYQVRNGKDGADGKIPVKGEDYFTEADKSEMVSAVISALPKYNGEVVAV